VAIGRAKKVGKERKKNFSRVRLTAQVNFSKTFFLQMAVCSTAVCSTAVSSTAVSLTAVFSTAVCPKLLCSTAVCPTTDGSNSFLPQWLPNYVQFLQLCLVGFQFLQFDLSYCCLFECESQRNYFCLSAVCSRAVVCSTVLQFIDGSCFTYYLSRTNLNIIIFVSP
jgi:hypothetical protein